MSRFAIIFQFLMICIGCFGQTKVPIKLTGRNPSDAAIMRAIYGSYDVKTKTSKWQCTARALLDQFSIKEHNATMVSTPLYVDSSASKQINVLIATNSVDNICHGCSPVLEFYSFTKMATLWILKYNCITQQTGSYGTATPFKVKKIGRNTIGFLFQAGFTGQGITEGRFVMYSYINGVFKSVWQADEAFSDNEGNCDPKMPNSCYSYDSTVKFLDAHQDLYDIQLTKKGTELVNGEVVKINTITNYQFVKGQYIKK